jgi:integrase
VTPKTRAITLSALERFFFPAIGDLGAEAVDRPAILRCVTPVWKPGRGLTAIARTLTVVARILDFAVFRGLRPAGPNPAAWKNGLEHDLTSPGQLHPSRPMPSLPYSETPAFFASLGSSQVEQALKFIIATGVRTQEALLATWPEIDREKALWIIPAAHTKMSREHRVPLSPLALDILAAAPTEPGNVHLFIGNRKGAPLTSTAIITWMRRRGLPFSTHGFRATFRSWGSEQTPFPPDVLNAVLAHAIGSGTAERAYNRAALVERRRPLMNQWAGFLTGAAEGAKVVEFSRRGSGP